MKSIKFISYVLVMVLAIGTSQADLISVKYDHMGASSKINIAAPKSMSSVSAGLLVLKKNSGSDMWANGTLAGFCIEIEQNASSSYSNYTVGTLDSVLDSGTASAMRELWGRYYDESWMNTGNSIYNVQAAAFQTAVWELIYDGIEDVDLAHGGFSMTANESIMSLANTWLGSLDGSGPKADLRILSNASHQDFVVEVPEPMTLVMFVSALGCMGLRWRKTV